RDDREGSVSAQAVVLWGGWLVTGAVFFSVAEFFHEYYMSMLAPPATALFGLGVTEVWRLWRKKWWAAAGWLAVTAGATLAVQMNTARAFLGSIEWLPIVAGLAAAGALLLVAARGRWSGVAQAGMACAVGALLVTPGIWS